jgi:hypothetical protein
MALSLYIPSYLDSEIQAFKNVGGNHSLAYQNGALAPNASVYTYSPNGGGGVENIQAFTLKDNTFNSDFNIYPLVIPTGVTHPSGDDENWRSVNYDLLTTATLSPEVFTVGFFGSEMFSVTYTSAIYHITGLVTSVTITYAVNSYNGVHAAKTLSNLYEGSATLRPLIIDSTTVTEGLIDTVTLQKLKLRSGIVGIATSTVPLTSISTIEVIYSPSEALSDGTDYDSYLSDDYKNITEFLIQEATPTTRINIEIVSGVRGSGTVNSKPGWITTGGYTFPSGITNYKDAIKQSTGLTADPDLLGYTGTLSIDEGIMFNISVTSLKTVTYNYTADYATFPSYRVYEEIEPLRTANAKQYMLFSKGTTISSSLYDGSNNLLGVLPSSSLSNTDAWTLIGDLNTHLRILNSGTVFTMLDGELATFKMDGDIEQFGVSNSAFISDSFSTSLGQKVFPSANLTINSVGYYTSDNTAYNISDYGSGNTQLNFLLSTTTPNTPDYSIVSHTISMPATQFNTAKNITSLYNSTTNIASMTLSTSRTIGYSARQLSNKLMTYSNINADLLVYGKPDGHVLVRNTTSSPSSIILTNVFDYTISTDYGKSLVCPYNSTFIYGTMNSNNIADPIYNSIADLAGYPVGLTIRGYDTGNDFYLKLIKSDNPDYAPNTSGSFTNSTDNNLIILTDKINQYTRSFGVLSSPLTSTDIALYKATGTDNTVIDTYLYSGATTGSPFVGHMQNVNLTSDSTKNYTGLGANTSRDFWYYEGGVKQPILLNKQTAQNITSNTLFLQFVQGSSDTVFSLKVEDLSSLVSTVVSVSFPAYSDFTGAIATWYSELSGNINTAVQSVIGTGKMTTTVVSQAYNTGTGSAIVLTNDSGNILRQVKIGVPGTSSVTIVKLAADSTPLHESQTTDIFSELSTPNNISFWLG